MFFDHSWSGGFGQLQTVFIAPIRYPRVRLIGLGSDVLLLVLPYISRIERPSAERAEHAESSVASSDESWKTAMSPPQAACQHINTSHHMRLFDLLGFCGLHVCDHVGHQRALIKQRCYRPGVGWRWRVCCLDLWSIFMVFKFMLKGYHNHGL